ncbi:hypothetical protein D3C84_654930 [compost metagenome]
MGVLGAVFEAGQVMAVHMAEGFVHLHQTQRRGQCRFDGVAAVEQFATVFTVQPAPERVLGRRIVDADARQRRERPQTFDLPVQRPDQGLAEAGHHRLAVHQPLQVIERGRQCSGGFEREEHMAGLRRNGGGENARLVMTHMNSLKRAWSLTGV